MSAILSEKSVSYFSDLYDADLQTTDVQAMISSYDWR